jgi:hypothetical protein
MPEPTIQAPDTFAPKDIAMRWGNCKVTTVLHKIKTGQLEAFDVSRNPGTGRPRWRIHKDAVEAYERRHSATAQADAKRELRAQRRRRRERAAKKSAGSQPESSR